MVSSLINRFKRLSILLSDVADFFLVLPNAEFLPVSNFLTYLFLTPVLIVLR